MLVSAHHVCVHSFCRSCELCIVGPGRNLVVVQSEFGYGSVGIRLRFDRNLIVVRLKFGRSSVGRGVRSD